ncbi:MAG: NTP transferase domain-containing protein [Selenomonadaceae bacterium]|nr:NTP transferase domain-containing protein [Selenomonadaceae bacterium]
MMVGAVVVAAGLSSRMGDFKPMMLMGTISISQRIIATLKQAGVSRIVFVTGHRADELEHHLTKNGVLFLRNPEYRSTDMFESACIGLSYIESKCDRVLFTPVDIPLFTSDTVRALLASAAELAVPVCDGVRGHPILMSSRIIHQVLRDSGEGGLRGALSRSGAEEHLIEVADRGILMDMDTQEDYTALLEYHNSQLIRPAVQVAWVREKVFFNAQTALLLSLIDELGSVSRACKRMQLSYSSGWNRIKTVEEQSGIRLVMRNQGGAKGSSSSLTKEGRQLLQAFERYEAAVRQASLDLYRAMFPEWPPEESCP